MVKDILIKKVKRSPAYKGAKSKLLKAFVLRKTLQEIADELHISIPTAFKWQKWMIEEEGDMNDAKMHRMKKEFITKNLAEIEFAKEKVIKCMDNNRDDPKAMSGLTGSLAAMHRDETDILSRFNIIQPEQIEVKHFAGEGIEIVFLDENKRKMIDVVPTEVVEE